MDKLNKNPLKAYQKECDELNKQKPDKSRLKSFWSGIEKVLPTINTIATSVAKIVPLFL